MSSPPHGWPLSSTWDEIVGFHAQQAIEKQLKAVLIVRGVALRRTHDLVDLLDTAKDGGVAIPSWLDEARALNPYAVEYRYGAVEPEVTPLDRLGTVALIERAQGWAEGLVRE